MRAITGGMLLILTCLLMNCAPTPSGVSKAKTASEQLGTLTNEGAKNFINSWCGSGVLTNLEVRDADEYLISYDVPSWFNVERHNSGNNINPSSGKKPTVTAVNKCRNKG